MLHQDQGRRMKVRKLLDTCVAFPKSIKIMAFIDKLGRFETIWSGGHSYDVPTDLLKIQVDAWDLYTEIVKDRDYTGEVVSEEVEIELRIYVSEDDL